MHIQSIYSFKGRNIYSHKPVIKMILDIGQYEMGPTREIPGFNKRLLDNFPELASHACGVGYAGGFGERLIEGTYIGHVTEHLIIEIQNKLGYNVGYGKTRQIGNSSVYYVIYEYENEVLAVECGKSAVEIIDALAKNIPLNIQAILDKLNNIARNTDMGPSTRALYDEAQKRGIPVSRIGSGSMLRFGYGKYTRVMQASLTDRTSCISVDTASNKQLTKRILMDNNIPVPYGIEVNSISEAITGAQRLGYPLVVKPIDSNQGKGVTTNIVDESHIRWAFDEAQKYSGTVIVERYIPGKDYRVLVVDGKMVAAAQRIPPSIIGNGQNTIRELVEIENQNPLRGFSHEKPLTRHALDEIALNCLSAQLLEPESIPCSGQVVYLRQNANLSTGGSAIDCTNDVHPQNANYAIAAASAIGLDIAGIDIIAKDIGMPIDNTGAIIEVNAAPGLRMHLYPSKGKPVNVAGDIMDMLYPDNTKCTIPIVAVTGTNGKTTTTRLIRHTLIGCGLNVGMTSTSGIYIGNRCIQKGDTTGPISARLVLNNKEIDAAVLETARGGIVRKGLGYDVADVAVLTNITEDHLGIDGVETLEQLAHIKSLVIEAVKPEGYAVLNADDAMTPYLISRLHSKLILFSHSMSNPLVKKHCRIQGNIALYIRDNYIWILKDSKRTPLIGLEDIPITNNGMIECNVENSLAAAAALVGLGISCEDIKAGMSTFNTNANPGRFNIFDMGKFKVMIDYSHNIAGYSAVIKYLQRTKAKRLVGVIGMPGDRLDSNIRDVGAMCAKNFEKIYIKEDIDLRGRKPGEVAGLLNQSILESGFRKEDIQVIYSEVQALEKAMLDAQPGDLIILFYEQLDAALQVISKFRSEQEAAGKFLEASLYKCAQQARKIIEKASYTQNS